MTFYNEKDIVRLAEQFETKTLPKLEWTHEAHLIVGVWHCYQYGASQALELVRHRIAVYNESVGTANTDTSGYHETITRFWLMTIHHFLATRPHLSLEQVCNDFIRSDFAQSTFPLAFYSKSLLFSTLARQQWVAPDLQVLEILKD